MKILPKHFLNVYGYPFHIQQFNKKIRVINFLHIYEILKDALNFKGFTYTHNRYIILNGFL